MDSGSCLASVFHNEFVGCKRQIDSLWSDIDEICVDVMKNAVTLCFKSTKIDSNQASVTTEVCPKPIDETQPASTDCQLSEAPAPKKFKLSLHSQKCEHSPHNRRNKRGAEIDDKTVNTPGNVTPKLSAQTSRTPGATGMPKANMETPKTADVTKPTNKTFTVENSTTRPMGRPSKKRSTSRARNTTLESCQSPTVKSSPSDQVLNVVSESSNTLVTQSPSVAAVTVANHSTPDNKEVTSVVESPVALPTQSVTDTSEASPITSAPLKDIVMPSAERDTTKSTTNCGTQNDMTYIRTNKQTSLGMERSLMATKMHPFCSMERLGGISRLNIVTPTSSTDRSSKIQQISQKIGSQTSLLNDSRGGTTRSTERSQSVLAMKEHLLAEKQRIYRERLKENAERLRAFQEAKQREREAQKRANEERRLAVKQKAQQLAEMQRAIAENKQRLDKARAQAELDKQKTATATKPAGLSRIQEKENQPPSHSRPPPPARIAQPQPTISKLPPTATQPIVRLQTVKLPVTVLKPVQPTHPPVANVNSTQQASKITTTTPAASVSAQPPVTVTQSTAPLTSIKTATQPCLPPEQIHINLDTSTGNETFDMSQLKSDSESDSEQPTRKIPGWSRKGNQNLIDTLRLIHNGKLKWPSEFLTASEITFDIDEVFHGYKFLRRARTSSGVWNTPTGQFPREH